MVLQCELHEHTLYQTVQSKDFRIEMSEGFSALQEFDDPGRASKVPHQRFSESLNKVNKQKITRSKDSFCENERRLIEEEGARSVHTR